MRAGEIDVGAGVVNRPVIGRCPGRPVDQVTGQREASLGGEGSGPGDDGIDSPRERGHFEADLGLAVVRAPFAGQVLEIYTRAGEKVGADGIAELAMTDAMYTIAEVYETDVGRVHLGVVHVFKLDQPKVAKREAMITNLEFLSREELCKRRDTLETWSQLCVDQLGRLLA